MCHINQVYSSSGVSNLPSHEAVCWQRDNSDVTVISALDDLLFRQLPQMLYLTCYRSNKYMCINYRSSTHIQKVFSQHCATEKHFFWACVLKG